MDAVSEASAVRTQTSAGVMTSSLDLLAAVQNGDVSAARDAVLAGADVNYQTSIRDAPLFVACRLQGQEMVEFLLSAGADPGKTDKFGRTCFHIVCEAGNVDGLKALLQLACDLGRCSVDMQDDDGRTPLMIAAKQGYLTCMQLLIDAQCDVNLQDKHGSTALHYACECTKPDACRLLAQHCDLNKQNQSGNTPLHRAAHMGHFDVCWLLVSQGAQLSLQNNTGKTALDMANRSRHQGLIRLLSFPGRARMSDVPGSNASPSLGTHLEQQ